MLRRSVSVTLVAFVALGAAACSDEDRDQIGQTVDSLVDDVQDAANTVVSNAEEAAGDVVNDAAEAAVRNVAAQAGRAEFSDAGHPIDGELTCEAAVAGDASQVDVTCSGTTEAGGAAELTGQTSEVPGAGVTDISGTFTGTVDGAEVFTADALGA